MNAKENPWKRNVDVVNKDGPGHAHGLGHEKDVSYLTLIKCTLKINVSLGPIAPPAPASP